MKKKSLPIPFTSKELTSWNFIIFLMLAFLLLVMILSTMRGVTTDLRSKAGLSCPVISQDELPLPEDCPGGKWDYIRSAETGCPSFVCHLPSPTPAPKSRK